MQVAGGQPLKKKKENILDSGFALASSGKEENQHLSKEIMALNSTIG